MTKETEPKTSRMSPLDVINFRRRHEFTQESLAEFLGMSLSGIKAWENGNRRVPEPLCRLFDMFDNKPELMREY